MTCLNSTFSNNFLIDMQGSIPESINHVYEHALDVS